jgi:hypothetical protein
MTAMRNKRAAWVLAVAASGCAQDGLAGTDGESDELATQSQPLYGDLTTSSCTATQRETLVDAHQSGMDIAMTDAFDACLRHRVYEFYKPCWQGDDDPYASSDRLTQYTRARDIMRSGNTAGVTVTCEDLGGAQGRAGVGDYGDSHESMSVDESWLDTITGSGFSDWERSDLAGTIWHEAMHQQGYRHDECGYPESEYSRGANSIPYMSDRCMRSAGLVGRAAVFSADGRSQSLGIGRHFASQGHLGGIGDNSIAVLRLPPASRLTYCRDEGGTGTNCNTLENLTLEYGDRHAVSGSFVNTISYVEVTPLVLAFSQTEYRGNVQAFGYGEFRANTGDFAVVGNDQTRSIYVPPGTKVRVCSDEGGTSGHGYWNCAYYERSAPNGVLAGVSYAEVQPVVTAFREREMYGYSASFGPGRWAGGALGSMGDNAIAALVVPPGLTARVCSDAGSTNQGAGACTTFARTTFDVGDGLVDAVSFLEVTPDPLGTYRLTVARAAGSRNGRIVSAPLNLDCTGACSASFPVRSEVKLTTPGVTSTTQVDWSGCDREVGTTCYVSMMSSKTVTVDFKTLDGDCYQECLEGCNALGDMLPRQCVQMCRAECTD